MIVLMLLTEQGGRYGSDILASNFVVSSNPRYLTSPDNSKDRIDCGAGEDEVWTNKRKDKDVAINCEIVHSEFDAIISSNITDIAPTR
jgi:hypothetical protein